MLAVAARRPRLRLRAYARTRAGAAKQEAQGDPRQLARQGQEGEGGGSSRRR